MDHPAAAGVLLPGGRMTESDWIEIISALLLVAFGPAFLETPLHLLERDGLSLPALLDHLPEGGTGLVENVFPILALDPDQEGGRLAVSRDDHALLLGDVHAFRDLPLEVADVHGLRRMSSVVL